jgi:hypothetical protein
MYIQVLSRLLIVLLLSAPLYTYGATQSGGGYIVNGQVNPSAAAISGNGITSQSGGNPISQVVSGGGGVTSYGGAYRGPVVDVCVNITGLQATVPPGYSVDGSGNCTLIPIVSGGGGGGGGTGASGQIIACPQGTVGVYPQCKSTAVITVGTSTPTEGGLTCADTLKVSKLFKRYRNH